MLKFLRIARRKLIDEGSLKKYLLYTLGEILIVVIGIFIAVQLNNWNESRKEEKKARSYLAELKDELLRDIKYLLEQDSLLSIYESSTNKAILQLQRAKNISDILIADSLFNYRWSDLIVNSGVYEEMLYTGNFYSLKNKVLQEMIANHYKDIEAKKYITRSVNTGLRELQDSNLLHPYHFLKQMEIDQFNALDTSWIGNPNASTFIALNFYYGRTQTRANILRRSHFSQIITSSKNLIEQIDKELGVE
ncbi:MAG: DUF6090 family protein [Bacteroidota bacterium]